MNNTSQGGAIEGNKADGALMVDQGYMQPDTGQRTMQAYGDSKDGESAQVIIVAGEASADLYGSMLVRTVNGLAPDVNFCGIGGKKMERAGVRIFFSSAEMAVVGLTEIISKSGTIRKALRRLKALLKSDRPRLLILIDYPGFNLHLARHARRLGIPVLYYISPQVWAWRRNRVKKIARRVDRLAVILPFEKQFFRSTDLAVDYVGHPLMDTPLPVADKATMTVELGIREKRTIIGLLPGSRKEEICNLLPVMVESAELLKTKVPNLACVLPLAETIDRKLVTPYIEKTSVEIAIVPGDTYKALSVCSAAMVTSGTATLETAIMGVPMVVVYRASPLSYWVAKRVVKVPYISLVNLVGGKEVVRELIQDEVTSERLSEEVFRLLDDSKSREAMVGDLNEIRRDLGKGGATLRTARIALDMLGRKPAPPG
ncbi:MAG: lipid-A-disaccharide synthase [Deltaproteobacteria bacterium]|nr:lipid-A-disaccharide synthase [Deltaproteobacteria bacterium]